MAATSTPRPRRRSPLRIVLTVLIALVALVLVAVLGLVGWATWRPLLPGDYQLANNRFSQVGDQLDFVGSAVGSSTGALTSGSREVVTASAQSVRDQVGLAHDEAQKLSDLRALKDPEVGTGVESVQRGMDELQTYLRRYADAMIPVAEMDATCEDFAGSDLARPLSEATEAEVQEAAAPCLGLAERVQQSGPGAWTQLGDAQVARIEGIVGVFALIESDPDDPDAWLDAEQEYKQAYEDAVLAANTAQAEEFTSLGDAVVTPLNEVGTYTAEKAGE